MSNEEESKNNSEKGLAQIPTKSDEDHDDTAGVSMSSFYSLDKPKDAFSGTSQGVGNILKGIMQIDILLDATILYA